MFVGEVAMFVRRKAINVVYRNLGCEVVRINFSGCCSELIEFACVSNKVGS